MFYEVEKQVYIQPTGRALTSDCSIDLNILIMVVIFLSLVRNLCPKHDEKKRQAL